MTVLGIIRIRGKVNVSREDEETLLRLGLKKRNNMSVFYDSPSIRGMIKKVEKYVAWGEIDDATLALIFEKRGVVVGGQRLNLQMLRDLGCQSYVELAEAIAQGRLNDLIAKGLSRTFAMTPPSKGFKGSLKKPFSADGVFGYHGNKLAALVKRMV
jgi:large subunit ribosomal protein L30